MWKTETLPSKITVIVRLYERNIKAYAHFKKYTLILNLHLICTFYFEII
jgi:hypothetical protein